MQVRVARVDLHIASVKPLKPPQSRAAFLLLWCLFLPALHLQNDLEEFFAMVDFTNPGVLGDVAAFRRKFQTPISVSREPWATGETINACGCSSRREASCFYCCYGCPPMHADTYAVDSYALTIASIPSFQRRKRARAKKLRVNSQIS